MAVFPASLPAQEHAPLAMHRLTSDLLQFPLCLFLPLPIRTLLPLEPGGDPWHGHTAGSCLCWSLARPWRVLVRECGELASSLGCCSHSLPRYSVSAFILPGTVPHLPRSEKGDRGSDFQESWALCHGDTIPAPAPTDSHPLPVPMVGILSWGKNHLYSGNPHPEVNPVPWATKHTLSLVLNFDALICPQKQHYRTSHC